MNEAERDKILALSEGRFCDLKATALKPAKLTRSISALSNAEGGALYIGIEEDKNTGTNTWNGFNVPEDANGHLQGFETLFPLGDGCPYAFLRSAGDPGLVLKIDIAKSRDVKSASDGTVLVRRGAQNLPVDPGEGLIRQSSKRSLKI